MISQVPISARINATTKWRADQFAYVNCTNRNRMINRGLEVFMSLEDMRANLRYYKDKDTRRKILKGFLKTWVPELDPDYQL
jgi:hypothetical protein